MFKWFKSKKKSKPSEVKSGPLLHGHDLDKWTYLGYTDLKLDDVVHPAFMFCSKDDLKKRSYTIKGFNADLVKKYHTYVHKYLDPWSHGENEIYHYVNHPSNHLKQWMYDYFGSVWDKETEWWKTTEQGKHHQAKVRQDRKKKDTPPNQGSGAQKDPIVIQVDFGKKNED